MHSTAELSRCVRLTSDQIESALQTARSEGLWPKLFPTRELTSKIKLVQTTARKHGRHVVGLL